MENTLFYTTHQSVIGRLLLVAGGRGLHFVTLLQDDEDVASFLAKHYSVPPIPMLFEIDGFFSRAAKALDAYLSGVGPLKLPYDLVAGTPLQRAVWIAISKIPYGQTTSYTALAEQVGFPRAVRAVASACGANPLPLVIPCHRVIAKDGSLGGFSLGGLEVKERLLSLEAQKRKAA